MSERKVRQMVLHYDEQSGPFFGVVCEDGTMWTRHAGSDGAIAWIRIGAPLEDSNAPS